MLQTAVLASSAGGSAVALEATSVAHLQSEEQGHMEVPPSLLF